MNSALASTAYARATRCLITPAARTIPVLTKEGMVLPAVRERCTGGTSVSKQPQRDAHERGNGSALPLRWTPQQPRQASCGELTISTIDALMGYFVSVGGFGVLNVTVVGCSV